MNKTLIIFADTTTMCDFIFSRQLCCAEVNSKERTIIALMEENDVIDAVTDYNGHLNENRLYLPKTKC
jgi:hypothetical protein